jgi:hypothetical protein
MLFSVVKNMAVILVYSYAPVLIPDRRRILGVINTPENEAALYAVAKAQAHHVLSDVEMYLVPVLERVRKEHLERVGDEIFFVLK